MVRAWLLTMQCPLPRSRDSGQGIAPEDENVGRQGERQKSERHESPTACGPTVWQPIRSPSLRYFLLAMHHTFQRGRYRFTAQNTTAL